MNGKLINMIVFLLCLGLFGGCLTTKPNPSYLNNILLNTQLSKKAVVSGQQTNLLNEQFRRLYLKNPEIALEMGKLPEFQKDISENVEALKKFVDFYLNNDNQQIKATFEKMFKEGKPEVRKYCTPLRFVFWLAQEEKSDADTDFSVLLRNSLYGRGLKDSLYEYNLAKLFYRVNERVRRMDVEEVIDMLNSPELISIYWTLKNLAYKSYIGHQRSSKKVLKDGGNCVDQILEFAILCLRRSGYKAEPLPVVSPRTITGLHMIAYYIEENGKISIMDSGNIGGPYESLEEIPYTIAAGKIL